MGQFLAAVGRQDQVSTQCSMIGLSLSKIRELHGSFKSICDNFAINLTEFETIFAQDEKSFSLFDTDSNGLIDALELFSGLVVFSDANAEEKVRFLFDLFDFNEIQSLSSMDLQFAIQCVLNATSKIFTINQEQNDEEINTLVKMSFNEGVRVTLPQILKWSALTDEITTYFNYFRMDGPEMRAVKQLQDSEFETYQKFQQILIEQDEDEQRPGDKLKPVVPVDQSLKFISKQAYQLTQNRRSLNFRSWLTTALQPIIAFRVQQKISDKYQKVADEVKVKLEWVYGIRASDTRKALQYTVGQITAQSTNQSSDELNGMENQEEEIIYYIASIVVLLNTNLNRQRFYTSHDNEVISVAVSTKEGSYIASSEFASAPAIHVWSRQTLESLSVIRGDHAMGVHLLSFTHDNKFLVSCGTTNPSAVIIYDWRKSQVVMSTSIHSPTQDIFLLHEITYNKGQNDDGDYEVNLVEDEENERNKRPRFGVVILSLKEICVFIPKENTFDQTLLPLEMCTDECELYEPMCGLAIIADQNNTYFTALGIELTGKRHIFLTGHKDGKVLLWRSDSYLGILTDFEEEVTCMSRSFDGLVFCTWGGRLHFWDNNLSGATKTIELQSLPFRLLNYNISAIDFNQRKLMILTVAGDAVEITMTESEDETNQNQIKAKRINSITKITGQQKALAILNQIDQVIVIGGDDGIVCSYDIATHTLMDVWTVGAKITAIALLPLAEGGFITAVGTTSGNIVIRQDYEDIPPRYQICGTKTINDVQFSKNGQILAAASNDKFVYLFKYVDGDYQKLSACKLENGIPVSVNFSEDSKKIVICTNQRKLLLLDPVTFQLFFRAEDITQHMWQNWNGRYPLNTKSNTSSFIPISLGNQSNIVIAGDENGNIYIWRDTESVKEHVGVNLVGHSSPIQRICLTFDDKRMLTLGQGDQCLLQWKLSRIEQQSPIENGIQTIKAPKISQDDPNEDLHQKIFVTDESLINELNFCYISPVLDQEDENPQTKPVDNAVLIRGSNSTVMNRLGSKFNFDYEEELWKRPPSVALVIDHIYGVQTSDRRNTVIYMHFHGDKPPPEKLPANTSITAQLGIVGVSNSRLDQVLPKLLGPNFQQLLDPNQAIKYDPCHQSCHKHLVYFTSRFGILYSPSKNIQTFYQGHILKISCIQKHPIRRLIATGEVSLAPQIHIWDAQTLEPVMILDTSHKGGILHLAFSPDGKKLVSIGMDRVFSVQIFLWEQNRTLAYRNLGYYPVFGLKFYPSENSRFITCGYEHMAVWRLQGNHLSCQAFQKYQSLKLNTESKEEPLRSVLISVDFLNYRLGHTIQSDIIFGTSQGEITTYCSGKHFVLNENAHKGSVNCIKVTDRLNDSINIITGGEDGLIKIWDTSIKLLQSIDIREQSQVLKEIKNQRSYGVQSIELYFCDRQNPKRMLVGLRCGEILEAVIQDSRDKNLLQPLQKPAGQTQIGIQASRNSMLDFLFYTFVSAHSSLNGSQGQKKINCVVNPSLPILASVGDDETLRFWDLIKKQIIISKYLGTQATAVAYSPDGAYLVIGLVNGIVLVVEARIQKLQYGTYMEEYSMPTLDILMSPKEAKAAIVCIKFSYRGDYLAVSFNNEYKEELDPKKSGINTTNYTSQDQGATQPSFIIIYVNRLSHLNPGIKLNTKDPYVKLMKLVIPLNDFQPSLSIRKKMAVTLMDFSDDDCYIQFCLQNINQETVIDKQTYTFGENNIFVIWDLTSNQLTTNFEALKNVTWPEWSMAPSINARYQGTEINLEDAIEERQILFRELCFMSRVARFSLQANAVCGSHDGGLYIFRYDSLTIDKLKVTDFKFDQVHKNEMAATRCFSGHTSMIQSIEIFNDSTVLTTSVSDQCIVQWKVEFEDKHWELDFNDAIYDPNAQSLTPQQYQDPYGEFISKDKLDQLIHEVWSQRLQVSEINNGVSKTEYKNPACEFELQYVIGRRAFDRRMNIKIDCMDRISYQASSLQIFLTENDEQNEALRAEGMLSQIKQEFLRPDGNKFKSVSPELSCFCYSKDARILFCATAQTIANIYIWEVTTNMKLGQFSVANCTVVTNIKVAHDSKQILILGISKEYYQLLTMVDWSKGYKIIFTRQFLHSLTCKIRDIEFMPESTRTFITAGIQHLCFWKLSGDNLEYQAGELTIPKAFSSNGKGAFNRNPAQNGKYGMALVCSISSDGENLKNFQDDDLENLYVTFLNVIFIGQTLITGGDDGFLYIWDGFRIIRRIFAHEGAIYALHCNSKLGLVVSGGLEGVVTLWRLLTEQKSNVQSLERLKIYNLRREIKDAKTAVRTPECNVQGLCLGFNRIIVGMRTGSIYEVIISEDRKLIKPHHDASKDPIKRWLRCSDHQIPKSVGIDMISSRVFTVTANGLFSVWDLVTFDIVYQKNYDKKTRFLQPFRLTNRLMLVFEHEICVVDSNPSQNLFKELPEYDLILNLITYATINQDEQILGVATISAAAPEVTLFGTDGGFIKIKELQGFKTSIRYLDFSTDNFYLQVEDNVGEVMLFEIESDKALQLKDIQFDLEWLGEGLRTYSRLQGLRHQFNQNNKIVKIKKLLGKPIVVVADELGTIRLFNFPNIKGEPYYQSYSDHLFCLSDCMFSPDRLFFVTSCEMDKCIFKWKIKFNEEKIQQMLEAEMRRANGEDDGSSQRDSNSNRSRRLSKQGSIASSQQQR